jgi:serine/threonine-protein kinase
LTGKAEKGISSLQSATSLAPDNNLYRAQLGQAYAMTGQTAKAREVLRQLDELSRTRHVSPYHFAYVYTGLGEQERALDWLERAYQERSGAIFGIKGSFLFTSLRTHPRFQALLRQMNLT